MLYIISRHHNRQCYTCRLWEDNISLCHSIRPQLWTLILTLVRKRDDNLTDTVKKWWETINLLEKPVEGPSSVCTGPWLIVGTENRCCISALQALTNILVNKYWLDYFFILPFPALQCFHSSSICSSFSFQPSHSLKALRKQTTGEACCFPLWRSLCACEGWWRGVAEPLGSLWRM